ncbi:MAG: PDZ domain-containing protein [Acidimicrobiia bacterium]
MRRIYALVGVMALVAGACANRSDRVTTLPTVPLAAVDDGTNVGVGACLLSIGPGLGAQVTAVTEGSGADGVLLPGDTIVDVAGTRVVTSADLREVVQTHATGEVVRVALVRNDFEPLTVEVRLGEHPDIAGTPLLGVATVTRQERQAVRTLAGANIEFVGSLVRVVRFEDRYLLFDPAGLRWASLGSLPIAGAETFVAGESEIYQFDSLPDGQLAAVGTIAGTIVTVAAVDWDVLTSLTVIDDVLLVGALQPDEGRPSGVQSAVLGIDATTGELLWTVEIADQSTGSFLPSSAARDPFRDRALIRLTPLGEPNPESHLLLTLEDGEPVVTPVRGVPDGALVIGWHARDRLLWVDSPQSLAMLQVTDVITGSTTEGSLPESLSGARTVWPAGDGEHVIVSDGTDLLYAAVGTDEVRLLTTRCGPATLGDPGWQAP